MAVVFGVVDAGCGILCRSLMLAVARYSDNSKVTAGALYFLTLVVVWKLLLYGG